MGLSLQKIPRCPVPLQLFAAAAFAGSAFVVSLCPTAETSFGVRIIGTLQVPSTL